MIPRENQFGQKLNGSTTDAPARPLSTTAPSTGGGIYGAGAGVQSPSGTEGRAFIEGFGSTQQEFLLQMLDQLREQEAAARDLLNERKGVQEPQDMFWNARFAMLADPFGHRWFLNAPLPRKKAPRQTSRVPGEVQLFKKVMERWGFGDIEAATVLGYIDPSLVHALYAGRTGLRTVDEKDRLRAILRIAADLHALFRDEGEVKKWLREPKTKLGGKSAYELMMNGSMEYLLYVRQFVEFLSGR